MQTNGNQQVPGAAPLRYGTESRQRYIIEQLTNAILYETLLILALIVFAIYQQHKFSTPEEVTQTVAAAPVDNMEKKYTPVAGGPDGEAIFDARCSSCHAVNGDGGTAPGLKDAASRVPSREWMYKWVRNPAALINAGDPYATKIYADYAPVMMTPQNLTDEQIDAVFDYVDAVNK